MKLGFALSLFAFVWCVAVLFKVLAVRGRGEPYRFTQWDGGLMLRGKELERAGTLWFAGFALVLGAISGYQLLRWMQL